MFVHQQYLHIHACLILHDPLPIFDYDKSSKSGGAKWAKHWSSSTPLPSPKWGARSCVQVRLKERRTVSIKQTHKKYQKALQRPPPSNQQSVFSAKSIWCPFFSSFFLCLKAPKTSIPGSAIPTFSLPPPTARCLLRPWYLPRHHLDLLERKPPRQFPRRPLRWKNISCNPPFWWYLPRKIGIFIDYVTGTIDTKKWRSFKKKGSHLFVPSFSRRPHHFGYPWIFELFKAGCTRERWDDRLQVYLESWDGMKDHMFFPPCLLDVSYCWWKKSCTKWYG